MILSGKALDLGILVLLAPTFSAYFLTLMGAHILALLHDSFSLVRSMFSFIAFSGFFAFFLRTGTGAFARISLRLLSFIVFSFSCVYFWDRWVCAVFLCFSSPFSIHNFAVGFFIVAAFFLFQLGPFFFSLVLHFSPYPHRLSLFLLCGA